MGYRCANDFFGYCSEEPKWDSPRKEVGVDSCLGGGSCKLNPKTCGKYKSSSQLVLSQGLLQSGYRVTKGGRIVKITDDKKTNHRTP